MTIRIKGERLVTTIYAKPMALYQYIPPSSCHPPGVLTSLIFGQILRIYQLCSLSSDIDKDLSLLYQRLLNRGYKPINLLPLLQKGINNAITYFSLTLDQRKLKRRPRSEGRTNASSSTSRIIPKTHRQALSNIFGET